MNQLLQAAREELGDPNVTEGRILGHCQSELQRIWAAGAAGSDPGDDLLIWRLARPGGLRELTGQRDPGVSRAWPVLAALGSTMIGLVSLELVVATQQSLGGAAPIFLGLIVVILIGLLSVSGLQIRTTWVASACGRGLQRIETDLLPAIAQLRDAARQVRQEDPVARAAGEISWAARRLGLAAEQITASADTVERLRAVATRVADALPEVSAQLPVLASLDERIRETAAVVGQATPPLAELVSTTLEAASKVREAIELASEQMRASVLLVERTADHSAAVSAGERPFTVAAQQMEVTSGVLDNAATMLRQAVERMQSAIEDANWLALVADGLRANDEHYHGR
ncbi:MAG: hypothetical protein JO100_18920 [Pseudonocardia sp.]|nr:hypothetical protein [Pseudonocardia sp.]